MPVTCPHCGREFKGPKLSSRHLSKCNPSLRVPVPPCLCGHESTSLTQMKRHRRVCDVWQTRDKHIVKEARRKSTLLEKYGVDTPRKVAEFEQRRTSTIREKYGADNVFSKDSSIFDKVQKSLEGNRFRYEKGDPNNPFSDPEIQKRIPGILLEKYGADSPQKVPEIRERTKQTNFERYGVEEILSSPEIRAKVRDTCEERYGGPAPSCDPEILEKARQTNLERWGVEWTCQHEDVRQKQYAAMVEKYGSHFFASEEGKEVARQGMEDLYGTWHPSLNPELRQKAVDTFRSNYPDVEWPCMLAWDSVGPNGFETRIASLFPEAGPEIEFTGNRTFWVKLRSLGRNKNPDFVVRPFRKFRKVIECFGDYFHSEEFTGKTPQNHEEEIVQAYAKEDIACLVIWESELRSDSEGVRFRIENFLVGSA